ncbi:MAG: hypothetical protein AAFQ21_01770 [Pseudomonadota bacterium]
MSSSSSGPNTLNLARVRRAGSSHGFAPASVYVNNIVAALEQDQQTLLIFAGGVELMIDMPLEKFQTRQTLDNPDN